MSWTEVISIVICMLSFITFGFASYDYYKYGEFTDSVNYSWGIWFKGYLLCLFFNLAFLYAEWSSFILNHSHGFTPMSLTSIVFYITLLPLILGKMYEVHDNTRFHFHLKKINKKRGQ